MIGSLSGRWCVRDQFLLVTTSCQGSKVEQGYDWLKMFKMQRRWEIEY